MRKIRVGTGGQSSIQRNVRQLNHLVKMMITDRQCMARLICTIINVNSEVFTFTFSFFYGARC